MGVRLKKSVSIHSTVARAEIKLWKTVLWGTRGKQVFGEIRESFQKDKRIELGLEAKKTRKGQGEGKDIHMEGTAYRGTEATRVDEHDESREPRTCWRKRTWH